MKRTICFFCGVIFCLSVFGLLVTKPVCADSGITVADAFPDPVFREWVKDNYLFDTEVSDTSILTNNQMDVIKNVQEIYIPELGITSLKGIEFFENLIFLDCSSNRLTDLNTSRNLQLSSLNCASNQLTELNVSANLMLDTLNCRENQLTSLSISQNAELRYFDCSLNQIEVLDLSANQLIRHLVCSGNRLTRLDLSQANQLLHLDCSMNRLTEIILSEQSSGADFTFGEQILYTSVGPDVYNGQWIINIREILGETFDLSDIRLTDSGTYSAINGVVTYSEQPTVVRFEKPIGKWGILIDYSLGLSEAGVSPESEKSNKTAIIIISVALFVVVSATIITIVLLRSKGSKVKKQRS